MSLTPAKELRVAPSNFAPPPSASLKISALPLAEVISLSVFLFILFWSAVSAFSNAVTASES